MTEFWLIRHGQTDWNLEHRYQGQTDIPLNQTGIRQAEQLSRELPASGFVAIYSSDLMRAWQTAEILAKPVGLTVIADRRLREIKFGEWEGQLVSDVRARYQAEKLAELKSVHFCPPGGETILELAERLRPVIDDIHRQYSQGRVLIVSHGLALAALFCQFNQIPLDKIYKNIPDNTQPLVIQYANGGDGCKERNGDHE